MGKGTVNDFIAADYETKEICVYRKQNANSLIICMPLPCKEQKENTFARFGKKWHKVKMDCTYVPEYYINV